MTENVKLGVAQSLTQKRCLVPVLIRRLLSTMERAEVSDTDREKIPLEVWQLCSFLGKRFSALFLQSDRQVHLQNRKGLLDLFVEETVKKGQAGKKIETKRNQEHRWQL